VVQEDRAISMMALEGLRMIDLARLLPGGYCSMLLADLGMDVLKIEDTDQGDYSRRMKPLHGKEGTGFLAVNRNKRSMQLNLKTPEGKKIFFQLASQCDVILESFRPGVVDRLGIGYEQIAKANHRIVYCSISGFGQDGPYSEKAGHDINYIALAGLLSLSGERWAHPVIPPVPIADLGIGGTLSAFAILAALIAREKTGSGQHIDISMTDGAVSWLCEHLGRFFATGCCPTRGEYETSGSRAYYRTYETLDGKYIAIGALEPKFWRNFCTAVGREDRVVHQFTEGEGDTALSDEIGKIIKAKSRKEWEDVFRGMDACFSPVLSLDEVVEHPQFVHRGIFSEIEHAVEGRLRQISFPAKLSDTPGEIKRPPPLLGQHTEEVLTSLGYTEEDIQKLKRTGVI
jgi:crotonobetainyl-CoA:carnitine CoA-transferase CaiB-like acyl-CoA transferase